MGTISGNKVLQSYTNTQGFQKKKFVVSVHMVKETFKVKFIFHTERVKDDWVFQILCVNQKVSWLDDLIDFDFKSYIKNKKFTIFLAFLNNLCYYRVKKMSNLILNGL